MDAKLNTQKELHFGVIGCGNIAQIHMQSIAGIPGAQLTAVADVNINAARAAGEKYGCRYYGDYRELIDCDDIDIVNVCTPSGLRKDIALYAAAHHKHIVLEKPIEVTVARIDEILTAAAASQVTVHGIFNKRFADLYVWLKDIVANQVMGPMFFADIAMKWYRPPAYYQGNWRGTWALDGGGALMNQCIHYVDLMQWYMGMPVSVFAYTGRFVHTGIETEDTAAALLKFQNGAIGMIQASTAMEPGFSARLSLHGTEGGIIVEDDAVVTFEAQRKRASDLETLDRFMLKNGKAENVSTHILSDNELHRRQLADITDSVRHGVPSRVSGSEARNAVEIIRAIYQSAQEGKEIYLSNPLPLGDRQN